MRNRLLLCLILCVVWGGVAFSADEKMTAAYPKDFKIIAVSGGVAPWESANKLEINADGQCAYFEMAKDDRGKGEFKEVNKFHLDQTDLNILYASILKNEFFSLDESYIAPDVMEGSFAELTVTVKGNTRHVKTQNTSVKNFDVVALVINSMVPKASKLVYNAILE